MNEAPAGASRKLYLRLGLLILIAASGFIAMRFTPVGGYLEKERMIALFEALRHEWWTPLLLIGLFCAAAPMGLPASPILVAGALVFGFWLGSLYNMVGLVLGAMIAFWVGSSLGRDAIVQLAGNRLRRAEKIFEKRGFWPLVQIRFLPIPFSVVSYAAALAGVSNWRFFVTSLLGLLPATVIHTYFVPKLIYSTIDGGKPVGLFFAWAGGLALLNLVAGWPTLQEARRRKKRYRDLRESRAARRPRA